MIYAEPYILLRVLHFFLHGLPTYEETDEYLPNGFDVDKENAAGLKFELKAADSVLGLLDLSVDPDTFGKQHPILICNPRQVCFFYDSAKAKTIKQQLYKVQKKYRQEYKMKKIRNDANNIKSMQHGPTPFGNRNSEHGQHPFNGGYALKTK